MTDQRIEPVDQIERAVGAELQVDGPEVDIGRVDERFDFLGGEPGALLDHAVLLDALKADRVVDQEVALSFRWKVSARDNLAPSRGSHHRREHFHAAALLGIRGVAGDGGAEVVGAP